MKGRDQNTRTDYGQLRRSPLVSQTLPLSGRSGGLGSLGCSLGENFKNQNSKSGPVRHLPRRPLNNLLGHWLTERSIVGIEPNAAHRFSAKLFGQAKADEFTFFGDVVKVEIFIVVEAKSCITFLLTRDESVEPILVG